MSVPTCETCGGALAAGADAPPCLCELSPVEESPVLASSHGGAGSEARALRCPSCGGWLESGVRHCTYCSVELASVRCWRCFDLSFAGTSICGCCGATLGLEGDVGPTGEPCPTCQGGELHLMDVGEHRIRECPDCAGVMVDHETLRRLTEMREVEAGENLTGQVQRTALTPGPVRYRRCPTCETIMSRKNFGARSGVIVDVCTEHGTWFDPEELTAVLQFVASGGLRESRRQDISNAERELSRKRMAAMSASGGGGGGMLSQRVNSHSSGSGALLSALIEAALSF